MKKIILCLIGVLYTCMLHADGIGTWKAYMAYHDVQQIEQAGNKLYVMASDNLFHIHEMDYRLQIDLVSEKVSQFFHSTRPV